MIELAGDWLIPSCYNDRYYHPYPVYHFIQRASQRNAAVTMDNISRATMPSRHLAHMMGEQHASPQIIMDEREQKFRARKKNEAYRNPPW